MRGLLPVELAEPGREVVGRGVGLVERLGLVLVEVGALDLEHEGRREGLDGDAVARGGDGLEEAVGELEVPGLDGAGDDGRELDVDPAPVDPVVDRGGADAEPAGGGDVHDGDLAVVSARGPGCDSVDPMITSERVLLTAVLAVTALLVFWFVVPLFGDFAWSTLDRLAELP